MTIVPKKTLCEAPFPQQIRGFHGGKDVDIEGVTGSIPVTPTIRTPANQGLGQPGTKCPTGSPEPVAGVSLLSAQDNEKLRLLTSSPALYCAEVMRAHLSEYEISKCVHCGTSLLIGGPRKSRRRSDARYCSDRCRVAAMRKRKKTEAV